MLIKNVLNNLGQYIRSRISLGIPKYENKISHSFFQRYCMKYENWKRNMKMYFKNVLWKTLETSTNFVDNPECTKANEKFDKIYEEKTNGIRIRSKCDWYEQGEKTSKSLLHLKSCAVHNQILSISTGNREVNNQKDINNKLYLYYKIFLIRDNAFQNMTNNFLNTISKFPHLSTEQSLECKKCITEKELFEGLKSICLMKNLLEMMALLKNFLQHFSLK